MEKILWHYLQQILFLAFWKIKWSTHFHQALYIQIFQPLSFINIAWFWCVEFLLDSELFDMFW